MFKKGYKSKPKAGAKLFGVANSKLIKKGYKNPMSKATSKMVLGKKGK